MVQHENPGLLAEVEYAVQGEPGLIPLREFLLVADHEEQRPLEAVPKGGRDSASLAREINNGPHAPWSRAIEVFDEAGQSAQIALFPENRPARFLDCDVVSIQLSGMRLRRPRQWGACWLSMVLWDQLQLDEFWRPALPPSREGTSWLFRRYSDFPSCRSGFGPCYGAAPR
jgi:hypothetical protein